MDKFHDAALTIVADVAEQGDDTGRKTAAAIGLFLAHDLLQTGAAIEAGLQAEVDALRQEINRLCDELAYWKDVAYCGVTPDVYERLGLPRRDDAA